MARVIAIRLQMTDKDEEAKEAEAVARLIASALALNGYDAGPPYVLETEDV